jgi:hypothetical protein
LVRRAAERPQGTKLTERYFYFCCPPHFGRAFRQGGPRSGNLPPMLRRSGRASRSAFSRAPLGGRSSARSNAARSRQDEFGGRSQTLVLGAKLSGLVVSLCSARDLCQRSFGLNSEATTRPRWHNNRHQPGWASQPIRRTIGSRLDCGPWCKSGQSGSSAG